MGGGGVRLWRMRRGRFDIQRLLINFFFLSMSGSGFLDFYLISGDFVCI